MEGVELDVISEFELGDGSAGEEDEDVRFGQRRGVGSRGRSIEPACWSRRGILFWRWCDGLRILRMKGWTWLLGVLVEF